jgi:hypothetical protein
MLYASSHYANCTQGVIDLCVRAVAAEGDLEHVLAALSGLEVALAAQEALEGEQAIDWSEGDPWREHDPRWRDWALTVYAEIHAALTRRLYERKLPEEAEKAHALWNAAIEAAAASVDRSPMLEYHDIYFDAAQSLVRRGDRLGIVRQVENLAEQLHAPRSEASRDDTVRVVLRDLALFHLDLGEHRSGLSILAALLRHAPKDVWTYNVIAMRFAEYGLPTIAHLAAEPGARARPSHPRP